MIRGHTTYILLLYMSGKFNLKNLHTTSYVYFNPNSTNQLDEIHTIVEMNDAFSLPNEDDKQDTYRHLTTYMNRVIKHSGFLCKGLNPEYIEDAFETADAIVAISSIHTKILPNGNIFGFALIQFNEKDNSMYIDVICSHTGIKYAGDILIKTIHHLCDILFIRKIKLKSVSTAIPFYEKYGFVKKDVCNTEEELCKMEKIVTKPKTPSKPKSPSKPKTPSKPRTPSKPKTPSKPRTPSKRSLTRRRTGGKKQSTRKRNTSV